MASSPAWVSPRTYIDFSTNSVRLNIAAASRRLGILPYTFKMRQDRGWVALGGKQLTPAGRCAGAFDRLGRPIWEETFHHSELERVAAWQLPAEAEARQVYKVNGTERINRDGVCRLLGVAEATVRALSRKRLLGKRWRNTKNPWTGYREETWLLSAVKRHLERDPHRFTVKGAEHVDSKTARQELEVTQGTLARWMGIGYQRKKRRQRRTPVLEGAIISRRPWVTVESVERAKKQLSAAPQIAAARMVKSPKAPARFDGRYPDGRMNLAAISAEVGWTVSLLKKHVRRYRELLKPLKQFPPRPRQRGRSQAEVTLFLKDFREHQRSLENALLEGPRPGYVPMSAIESAAPHQGLEAAVGLHHLVEQGCKLGRIDYYDPQFPVERRADGRPGRRRLYRKEDVTEYLANPVAKVSASAHMPGAANDTARRPEREPTPEQKAAAAAMNDHPTHDRRVHEVLQRIEERLTPAAPAPLNEPLPALTRQDVHILTYLEKWPARMHTQTEIASALAGKVGENSVAASMHRLLEIKAIRHPSGQKRGVQITPLGLSLLHQAAAK